MGTCTGALGCGGVSQREVTLNKTHGCVLEDYTWGLRGSQLLLEPQLSAARVGIREYPALNTQ